jgi:nicotinate phosphoribosyltransferase
MQPSDNLSLLTDLYQLTMIYGYWKNGTHDKRAVFHLYHRKNPFGNPYVLVGGLGLAVEYLSQLRFEKDDAAYLSSLNGSKGLPLFEANFLSWLEESEFTCSVSAMPEGTVAFPHEPLLRVEGPLWQCQLVETALLNIINFSSLVATKAARVKQAAGDDLVVEFGLRRAQGPNGALMASRAAYLGGCDATSNLLAGKIYGVPVKGTHAHSWVMSFDSEMEAFQRYAEAMPDNCIFLVDTYDTLEGVRNAIKVGRRLREQGHEMIGIRLDSGDLAQLSIEARALLDAAGFENAAIAASDSLDETAIRNLKEKGAKINIWGIGTKLATAYDQPALGGVYKLGALENASGGWDYKLKLSETVEKMSNPGILQVRRWYAKGRPLGDSIFNLGNGVPQASVVDVGGKPLHLEADAWEDLLQPIFLDGKLLAPVASLEDARQRAQMQTSLFDGVFTNNNAHYPTGLDAALHRQKTALASQLMGQKLESEGKT